MINAVFESNCLRLTSDQNGKNVEIRYSDYPAIFNHPRFLMVDFDKSEELLRTAYKQLRESWIIAPKVTVSVERNLAGGLTDIDKRFLKEMFVHAGSREVVLREN